MTKEELKKILDAHKLWLEEYGGKCADLSYANLRYANLRNADLRDADLRNADIDYSCWPVWCGGLHVKTDRRIMAQLAYHFCCQECDDPDYIKARNSILDFANTFHRADECGVLEPKEAPK